MFKRKNGRYPLQKELQLLLPSTIKFDVRPFANKFLKEMSIYFELVVFTAAEQSVSYSD
jgi:TFIIF-interacting CTD phosphatase-like protein